MKWMILAICAEAGVLLCLIFTFEEFSRKRMGKPALARLPIF